MLLTCPWHLADWRSQDLYFLAITRYMCHCHWCYNKSAVQYLQCTWILWTLPLATRTPFQLLNGILKHTYSRLHLILPLRSAFKFIMILFDIAAKYSLTYTEIKLPSVLWHCWLGIRKSIRPVKIEWWSVGVVICLQQGADCLHMVQLMPLPSKNPVISCLIKSGLVLLFWYWHT